MAGTLKGKQHQICSYYPPELAERLQELTDLTRRSLATYLREAAEDVLKKYAQEIAAARAQRASAVSE